MCKLNSIIIKVIMLRKNSSFPKRKRQVGPQLKKIGYLQRKWGIVLVK